jgi:hypothetical protein
MFDKGNGDEETKLLAGMKDPNYDDRQPSVRPTSVKKYGVIGMSLVAIVLGGLLIGYTMENNDTVNTASVERPIEFVTPSATESASPEPTQAPSSKAPEAPVKVEPSKTPTETAVPSQKPSKTAPAKCEVRDLKPHYAGDNYKGKEAVKVLLTQNKAWNQVYSGEFHFPSQQDQLQNIDELYYNMDKKHGPERSGLDFFMLYAYNSDTIIERLKEIDGPCKELADLDRNWIEGIPSLFKGPEATSGNPKFLKKLNMFAEEWLNDRNTVLEGQAS